MIHRRGLTMIEVVAASAILAAALGVTTQICVSLIGQQIQQRAADLALREATHAMLVAKHLPFAELSADTIESGCEELGITDRLHGHDMALQVSFEEGTSWMRDGSPSSVVSVKNRKVTADVSWQHHGQSQHVQLVTWRYAEPTMASREIQQP